MMFMIIVNTYLYKKTNGKRYIKFIEICLSFQFDQIDYAIELSLINFLDFCKYDQYCRLDEEFLRQSKFITFLYFSSSYY